MRTVLRYRVRQLALAEVGISEALMDRLSDPRVVRLVGGGDAGRVGAHV
jgi:hypothetical protein